MSNCTTVYFLCPCISISNLSRIWYVQLSHSLCTNWCKWLHTTTHPPTCPGIQSEDTIYTRAYSVFVQAFKARTNLCITHSKWGHFFTHLWTCLACTKRGLRPYPPTPILWKSEDSAHSHKAGTEILTSLCQNVLTLNVKKMILVLALNAGPNTNCSIINFWHLDFRKSTKPSS